MVNSLSTQVVAIQAVPPPSNDLSNLRRIINADLLAIHDLLNDQEDHLSQELSSWQAQFVSAMQSPNENEVIRNFLVLLEQILIDPITEAPLDDTALLATDGYTYDPKSLIVFLSDMQGEDRLRSPMNRENSDSFYTVSVHPAVSYLTNWIRTYQTHFELHPRLYPQVILNSYNELASANRLIQLPTASNYRLIEIRLRHRLREERIALEEEERRQELQAQTERMAGERELIFNLAMQQSEEGNRQDWEQLTLIRSQDIAIARESQRNLNDFSHLLRNAQERIANLQHETENIEQSIVIAERNDAILNQALAQTREAMKKAKKKRRKKLMQTIAIAGICALATIASGGAITAVPQPGGFKVYLG